MTRVQPVMVAIAFAVLVQGQTTSAQASKAVSAALQAAERRTPAPDFNLKDATGKTVRLSNYRGHVVLLDFWATTCGGCVEEIPAFVDVAKHYAGRGLTTIGIAEDIAYANLKTADEAWGRVRPFVREHNVGYLILMGDSRVTADYDIKALPLTYLVDAKGRVAASYGGVVDRANLEANIRTLLAER